MAKDSSAIYNILALNFDALEDDEYVIEEAIEKELEGEEVMAAAEDEIEAAYLDTASALVEADLIDEADTEAAAVVIANLWVFENWRLVQTIGYLR